MTDQQIAVLGDVIWRVGMTALLFVVYLNTRRR